MAAQLRFDSYNTFNHTQFSGVSRNARFNAAGNQVDPLFPEPSEAPPKLPETGLSTPTPASRERWPALFARTPRVFGNQTVVNSGAPLGFST